MRNLKKFLAVLVVVAIMATSMIPAFAEDQTELTPIEVVEALNLVVGEGDGLTEEYLAKDTTRIQAALIMLKALGLYEEAAAYESDDNFSDAEVVWDEGENVLAYLKATEGDGWDGNPDGTFAPLEAITAQQYYKVMLELLGYRFGEDYEWDEVLAKAVEFGMAGAGDYEDDDVIVNEQMAEILYEALYTPMKDAEDEGYTLLVALAEVNEDLAERALELGLIEVEPDEITMTASATAADTIKVEFNQPVDDTKAVFSVKKGTISVNIAKKEFAEDKASATLTLANKMTKGNYTVTVSGLTEEALTATIAVEDQKVTKIELTSDKLVLGSKVDPSGIIVEEKTFATVGYKIFDQYGTDVTSAKKGEVEWNATSGTASSTTAGELKVTYSNGFTLNMPVIVTGIDKVTGASVTATLTVSPMAYVSQITLGEVTVDAGKTDEVMYTNNIANFHIPLTVVDQYGNPMKNESIVAADLLVMPVNVKAIVDTDANGNLILDLAAADNQIEGYAAVNVVAKHSAAKASIEFTVNKTTTITEFSMELPELLVAGDTTKVKIPFTAIDQYGSVVNDVYALNLMMDDASIAGNTNLDADDFEFKKNYKTNEAELYLDLSNATDGTGYFTIITPGFKYYQTSFTVQEKAVPVLVSGTKDLILNMVKGTNRANIAAGNIVLKDQYGRDYGWWATGTDYRVVLTTSAADTVDFDNSASVVDTVYFENSASTYSIGANAVGSVTATATLQAYNTTKGVYEDVDGSSYSFTLKVVNKSDVATYEIADVGTMYGGSNNPAYNKTLDIVGKLADGSKVVLNTEVIGGFKSTNPSVLTVSNAGVLTAVYGSGDDVTVGVVVTIEGADGAINVLKNVKVSYAAPVATTFETTDAVDSGVYYTNNAASAINPFKVTDQYGVDITGTAAASLTFIITNVSSEGSITTDGSTITTSGNVKAGDTFVLTAITPNGLYQSIKVVITD